MSTTRSHFDEHLTGLSDKFAWAAGNVFHGASPLYEWLALCTAQDPEILRLAEHIPASQPAPNLLFGAVHFLLLQGRAHSLARYFPSVSGSPLPVKDCFPDFRAFCAEYAAELISLLETRRVQTNEVRRCAYLLPTFELVRRQEPGKPLALIEIGPSAGLNLLWDRYGYVYNRVLHAGNAESPVQITCEARGDVMPPVPDTLPQVVSRVGIDLMPGDIRDHDAMLWQRAMLWPDQPERAELFWKAVEVARSDPPRIVAGDALDALPGILASIPEGVFVGLYHSFVLNQFTPEARHSLSQLLVEQSSARRLYRVSIEWYSGSDGPQLELYRYNRGVEEGEHLASVDQHGRWLEWVGRTD